MIDILIYKGREELEVNTGGRPAMLTCRDRVASMTRHMENDIYCSLGVPCSRWRSSTSSGTTSSGNL